MCCNVTALIYANLDRAYEAAFRFWRSDFGMHWGALSTLVRFYTPGIYCALMDIVFGITFLV